MFRRKCGGKSKLDNIKKRENKKQKCSGTVISFPPWNLSLRYRVPTRIQIVLGDSKNSRL